MRVSPVVAGRELALRLKRRRVEMQLDIQTVSQDLNVTRNYWSLVENERRTPTEAKLRDVLGVLRFDQSQQAELVALRELALEGGWWSSHADFLPDELRKFFGLEFGAERVRSYESSIVNGLLQTEEYASEIAQTGLEVRPTDVRKLVEIRMERQQHLFAGDPVEIVAVMNEAALLQHVGGSGVLRRQLLHLIDLIERRSETTTIRVKPFTSSGFLGASTIYLLDFLSKHLPTVAWQESISLGALEDDPTAVNALALNHEKALERSLDQQASLDLISQYASKLA